MRISDWSSDVCSSDLSGRHRPPEEAPAHRRRGLPDPDAILRLVKSPGEEQGGTGAGRLLVVEDDPGVMMLGGVGAGTHLEPSDAPGQRDHSGEGRGRHQRCRPLAGDPLERSEEHTSELQSLMRTSYAVFCLKKKKKKT